jgi:ABC-type multidrug transport system permease subunit
MAALCIKTEFRVKKIKEELLSAELTYWRKKGIFVAVVLLSLFSFFITYKAAIPDLKTTLWQLRHFVGMAAAQSVAQISFSWFILKNKVPQYVILGFLVMVLLFQVTYGIAVILVANA